MLAFIGAHFFRALWLATMVLVPLFGFWLASSLAAYKNATQWLALLVGLLLFPGLPIGWELFAQWRKKKSADPKKPPKKAVLTRLDRMVLRTLLINGAFLFVTLYFAKATAFRALAVRGDWMCDGYEGALPDGFRHTILWVADRFDKRRVDSRYGDSDKAPDPWEMKRPLEQKPLTVETKKDPMAWPMDVAIDPIVRDMPEYEQSSIDSVGQYLKSRFPDTRLRAKAIHDFVVTRMHYDYDALEKINAHDYEHTPSQEAEDVFYRRAAVCEGYARLMVALGKSADVEIAYVTGYIRDSRRRLSLDSTGQPNLEGVSHAWNAVKIDGHWELVDATWDDPTNGSPTTTYLFTPPNLLTYDHLPEESAWQLRADSITLGDFVRQPLMSPSIGAFGLVLVDPTRSQITVDGEAAITFDNPLDARVSATARRDGEKDGKDTRCKVVTANHRTQVTCDLPDGEWEVQLFAARDVDARAGHYMLDYVGSILVNSH